MKEFFGIGGYTRQPEGYLSWQHLLFVTALVTVMILLAAILGKRNRGRSEREKNRVLMISAIVMDSVELAKIVLLCVRCGDPMDWLNNLPLFLCSIQLITVPLAAFSKGTVREAALDFVSIFGFIGAILGTYAAGNNYSAYPVLSLDNVASGITHCVSGFCSLYILISGMASMKKQNIGICFAILLSFCVMAYTANLLMDGNYMFLMTGDGTPYDILYNLVGGHRVFYPVGVVVLFLIYIAAFYQIYYSFHNKKMTL